MKFSELCLEAAQFVKMMMGSMHTNTRSKFKCPYYQAIIEANNIVAIIHTLFTIKSQYNKIVMDRKIIFVIMKFVIMKGNLSYGNSRFKHPYYGAAGWTLTPVLMVLQYASAMRGQLNNA
jgi:hypothetical protein